MALDGYPTPASNAPTPYMTPMPSGMSTPQIQNTSAGEYLGIPLGKTAPLKGKTYLAGSRALDSLTRLIASTESFFHPSNSGAWTADVCSIFNVSAQADLLLKLSAFIKYIVYDFNKRRFRVVPVDLVVISSSTGWHEEQRPDCKTPNVRTITSTTIRHTNNHL